MCIIHTQCTMAYPDGIVQRTVFYNFDCVLMEYTKLHIPKIDGVY